MIFATTAEKSRQLSGHPKKCQKQPSKPILVIFSTVVTPNKGMQIFGKLGQIREFSKIPLFAIFQKLVK